jgi:hypothetical protein
MSKFEERLWSELVRDHGAALAPAASAPGIAVPGSADHRLADRRAAHRQVRLSRRGWRVLAGVVLVGALAAAGTAIFGPTGNPKDITQFECGVGGHGDVHGLFTAEPVSACAALWPSLYHHAAPPLVAWVYETGGAVVVRPADAPPTGSGWRRLPQGWTADGAVIELNDQLEDITTGLPSRRCWPGATASALVRSILRADGLDYWHLRLSEQRPATGPGTRCLTAIQAIGGPEIGPDTVLLVEHATRAPGTVSRWYPNRFGKQRRLVETRVNRALRSSGGCASIAQAEALWRAEARAAGIPAREDVLGAPSPTSGASAGGGSCARVFVSEPGGGGPADVFAADYP